MEEKNQKIDCSVYSCAYNKNNEQECSLKKITVAPVENCETCTPDESMCSSYQYDDNPKDQRNNK